MKRVFLAVAAMLVMAVSLAQPAMADWRRYHDDDDWRWGRPPHHHRHGPWREREIFVVPPPRVVYVQPPMMLPQMVPASPVYTDGYGRYCREYQGRVTVGGAFRPSYGTACMMPDGSWQIVR